jgi:hypothetical protein
VTHEEKAVPQVRRIEARSRQNRRPDGVTDSFQIICHKIEPAVANRRINLLAKDDWRATLRDEPVPDGPEMPGVDRPAPFPGQAKGLAGAGTCPDGPFVAPSRKPERVGPAADPGEEMALPVSGKLLRPDILDPPFIHVPRRQIPRRTKVPEPASGKRVMFVVIDAHQSAPLRNPAPDSPISAWGSAEKGF